MERLVASSLRWSFILVVRNFSVRSLLTAVMPRSSYPRFWRINYHLSGPAEHQGSLQKLRFPKNVVVISDMYLQKVPVDVHGAAGTVLTLAL